MPKPKSKKERNKLRENRTERKTSIAPEEEVENFEGKAQQKSNRKKKNNNNKEVDSMPRQKKKKTRANTKNNKMTTEKEETEGEQEDMEGEGPDREPEKMDDKSGKREKTKVKKRKRRKTRCLPTKKNSQTKSNWTLLVQHPRKNHLRSTRSERRLTEKESHRTVSVKIGRNGSVLQRQGFPGTGATVKKYGLLPLECRTLKERLI